MKKLTTDEIISRAKNLYGDFYDYSKINYVNYDTKIIITCPKHGDFAIRPDHFLSGHGCPKCNHEKFGKEHSSNREEFIAKANKIHNDIYDYSKVEYKNAKIHVCIICPKHGEFWQTPDAHLHGANCPKCTHRSYKYTTEEFIESSKTIHGDTYDYSKVNYINRKVPVCIICSKHGEFWQKPHYHLRGHGCQICNESHLEREIKIVLEANNIEYEAQKRFDWLRSKYPMPIDFYLPKQKIAIECQGEQHFVKRWFSEDYDNRIERDSLKQRLCQEHGIDVLYYADNYSIISDWNKYEVIYDIEKLLSIIKNKDNI